MSIILFFVGSEFRQHAKAFWEGQLTTTGQNLNKNDTSNLLPRQQQKFAEKNLHRVNLEPGPFVVKQFYYILNKLCSSKLIFILKF